ncbi:hypothetical protein ES703_31111 [subsurface metagenome]
MFPPPVIQLIDPFKAVNRDKLLVQCLQNHLYVAHDGYVRADVLANFRRVNINVHDMGMRGKGAYLSRYPIIKSHTNGNKHIRALNGIISVDHPVHADHTIAEGMALRKAADTQQGGRYRYLCCFRQEFQFIVGF